MENSQNSLRCYALALLTLWRSQHGADMKDWENGQLVGQIDVGDEIWF